MLACIQNYTGTNYSSRLKETDRIADLPKSKEFNDDDGERTSLLYSAWSSLLTDHSASRENEQVLKLGLNRSSLPNAPHLENCKLRTQVNKRFDKRDRTDETFPPWTSWKGLLKMHPAAANNKQRLSHFRHQAASEGAYPPWVRLYV